MRKITLFLIFLMIINIFQTTCIVAIPGQTTITTNKDQYVQFETVTVTLTANSDSIPIDHFKAWACYDNWGYNDYAYQETDLPATLVSGTLYQATFNFQVAKGNKYLYIEARAFDDESRPGVGGQKIIYVEQQGTSGDEEPNDGNNLDQQNNLQSDYSSTFVIGFSIIIILLLIIIAMILVKRKDK